LANPVIVVVLALICLGGIGCQSQGASSSRSSSSPVASAAPTSGMPTPADSPAPPTPAPSFSPGTRVALPPHPQCQIAQLQIAPIWHVGNLSNDMTVFELRNRSITVCDLFGYPGASGVDSRGIAYGVAKRSTDSYYGSYPAPLRVTLPSGTPGITTWEGSGPPKAVPGHAYFDLTYGAACNGGVKTAADRWRIYPPDERRSMTIMDDAAGYSDCGLTVTPVGDEPTPSFVSG
jgi:hypothetical protein